MFGCKPDCSGETCRHRKLDLSGLPQDSSLGRCWYNRPFTSTAAFAGDNPRGSRMMEFATAIAMQVCRHLRLRGDSDHNPPFDLLGRCNSRTTVHYRQCCVLHEDIRTQLASCDCYHRLVSVFIIKLTMQSPFHQTDGKQTTGDEQEGKKTQREEAGGYSEIYLLASISSTRLSNMDRCQNSYNIYTKDRNLLSLIDVSTTT